MAPNNTHSFENEEPSIENMVQELASVLIEALKLQPRDSTSTFEQDTKISLC